MIRMNINVVYASDDNFAHVLGVSLISLLENNKNVDEINIHILSLGISPKNIKKIEA